MGCKQPDYEGKKPECGAPIETVRVKIDDKEFEMERCKEGHVIPHSPREIKK